jgi:hypothetical protein
MIALLVNNELEASIFAFALSDSGKPWKPQLEHQLVFGPIYESETFRMRSRSAAQSTVTFSATSSFTLYWHNVRRVASRDPVTGYAVTPDHYMEYEFSRAVLINPRTTADREMYLCLGRVFFPAWKHNRFCPWWMRRFVVKLLRRSVSHEAVSNIDDKSSDAVSQKCWRMSSGVETCRRKARQCVHRLLGCYLELLLRKSL